MLKSSWGLETGGAGDGQASQRRIPTRSTNGHSTHLPRDEVPRRIFQASGSNGNKRKIAQIVEGSANPGASAAKRSSLDASASGSSRLTPHGDETRPGNSTSKAVEEEEEEEESDSEEDESSSEESTDDEPPKPPPNVLKRISFVKGSTVIPDPPVREDSDETDSSSDSSSDDEPPQRKEITSPAATPGTKKTEEEVVESSGDESSSDDEEEAVSEKIASPVSQGSTKTKDEAASSGRKRRKRGRRGKGKAKANDGKKGAVQATNDGKGVTTGSVSSGNPAPGGTR
jgi:hypothetical protein